MKNANRAIFRVGAVRRYVQSREKTVLPRFVSPCTFIYLWILLGLLAASGFVAWFAQVPVYTSGPAVVVDWKGNSPDSRDDVVVVAFVPPEHLSRLRVGETLFLQFDPGGTRLSRSIMAVEPEISSPDAAQQRFALNAGAARAITQPATVVMARLEPLPTGLPASTYVGSEYRAAVQVGSRRVLSLLPLIGPFFGE